jgi:hypothetical protein
MVLDDVLLCVIAEKGKQTPKKKRAKHSNILLAPLKKMKTQTSNERGARTQELQRTLDNLSEIQFRAPPVQEMPSTSNGRQAGTQELPSTLDNFDEMEFRALFGQDVPSTSNEMWAGTQELQMTLDNLNEMQFRAPSDQGVPSTSNGSRAGTQEMQMILQNWDDIQYTAPSDQYEEVIDCPLESFPFLLLNDHSMSQKTTGDAGRSTTDVQALNRISTSGQAACGYTDAPCKGNETVGSYTSQPEEIKSTNPLMRELEDDTDIILNYWHTSSW